MGGSSSKEKDHIRPILYKKDTHFFSFLDRNPQIIHKGSLGDLVNRNSTREDKPKKTLAERRAKSSPITPGSLPVKLQDVASNSSPSIVQPRRPPRLDTSTLKLKSPEMSPMSAHSMSQALTLAQLAQTLSSNNYLPPWLLHLTHTPNPHDIRHMLNKTFRTISELEQNRLLMAFQHQDLTRNHAQQSPHLNRYTDILPYDHNRVKLGEDGYINASYLTCLDEKIKWIATQGPLPNTVCDFWQMVWEQQSSVIVMLTQEEERGRIKSHRYWPPLGDEALYEKQDIEFLVRNLDETTNEQIIKRVFQITYNGEQRTVTHIHFLGWPDHQVADPHQVLKVLDLAKEAQTTGHMIVHCSAGCGRTAAFCTIDAVLHLLKTGPELSPHPDWDRLPPKDLIAWQVDHFRRDRIGSVQTAHQFIFCYDAVLTRLGQWFQDGVECTWYEKETRRFSWRIK